MSGGTRLSYLSLRKTSIIFEWVQDPRPTGVVGDPPPSSDLWKVWARTVQRFGSVFRGSAPPTPEEDEAHYAYHYTNESGGESGTPSAYLEPGSHEWMATALCIFAICKKYAEVVETLEERCEELDNFLKTYPLEEQERKCREGLEDSSSDTMTGNHLLAYKYILVGSGKGEERSGFQATLDFVEGYVSQMMMIDASSKDGVSPRTLECFQRARDKEPEFYLWWHVSFLVIRAFQHNWNILELLEYSWKAHELAPRHMKIRTGICWMWAEIEQAKSRKLGYWTLATWDLIRSAERDLDAHVDPSELHSKWAVRRIIEHLVGYSGNKTEDEEKSKGLKKVFSCNSEGISSHDQNKLETDPSSDLEACLQMISSLEIPPENGGGGKAEDKLNVMKEPSVNFETQWKIISALNLECPPVWAANHLQTLPGHESKATYLEHRIRLKEFCLPNFPKDSSEARNVSASQSPVEEYQAPVGSEEWLSTKLSVGSVALLLDLHDRCPWNTFGACKFALWSNPKLCSPSCRQAYYYLVNAADLCKQWVKFKTLGGTEKDKKEEEEHLNQQIFKLQEEWETVCDSAAVHFVRGRVADVMGLTSGLDQYRKCAELEPENALWRQMIYEKLKQLRTWSGFGSVHDNTPGNEELAACQKALELSPENIKYMLDLVTVKMQLLTATAKDEEDEVQLTRQVEVIANLLGGILRQAAPDSRYEMLAELKIGELYTTKGLPQRIAKAEMIFLECYRKWPKCSTVLHKVARFYHYNCNGHKKSQVIYKQALQVAPQNYPCLMDYLKLLGRALKKYDKMIKVIDRSLPLIKVPEHVVRLLMIKGQACWLNGRHTREATCRAWLEIFQKFEWLGSNVMKALATLNPTPEFGKLDISLAELCPLFKATCAKEKIVISENKELKDFVEFLERAEASVRSRQ